MYQHLPTPIVFIFNRILYELSFWHEFHIVKSKYKMLHMPVMSCKLKKQPSSNRSRKIKIEFPDETNQMTFKDWCLPGTNYTVGQFDICSNCLETLVWTGDICLMTKKIWFLRNFCKILLRNSSVYSEWYTLHGIGIYRTWCVLCARRA